MKKLIMTAVLALLVILTYAQSFDFGKTIDKTTSTLKAYKKDTPKKVIIGRFTVGYSLVAREGAGSGTVSAQVAAGLAGISLKQLQQVTDSFYRQFAAQLTNAGYEVMDPSVVLESKHMTKFDLTKGGIDNPYYTDPNNNHGSEWSVYLTPTGLPSYNSMKKIGPGEGTGIGLKLNKLSAEHNAVVVDAEFQVYFMSFQTKGGGSFAEVKGTPYLYVATCCAPFNGNTRINFHYTNPQKYISSASYWPKDENLGSNVKFYTNTREMNTSEFEKSFSYYNAIAKKFAVDADAEKYSATVQKLLTTFTQMALDDFKAEVDAVLKK